MKVVKMQPITPQTGSVFGHQTQRKKWSILYRLRSRRSPSLIELGSPRQMRFGQSPLRSETHLLIFPRWLCCGARCRPRLLWPLHRPQPMGWVSQAHCYSRLCDCSRRGTLSSMCAKCDDGRTNWYFTRPRLLRPPIAFSSSTRNLSPLSDVIRLIVNRT
jgi:hypothetical protein